jgi:hypothetical protein
VSRLRISFAPKHLEALKRETITEREFSALVDQARIVAPMVESSGDAPSEDESTMVLHVKNLWVIGQSFVELNPNERIFRERELVDAIEKMEAL